MKRWLLLSGVSSFFTLWVAVTLCLVPQSTPLVKDITVYPGQVSPAADCTYSHLIPLVAQCRLKDLFFSKDMLTDRVLDVVQPVKTTLGELVVAYGKPASTYKTGQEILIYWQDEYVITSAVAYGPYSRIDFVIHTIDGPRGKTWKGFKP